MTILYIDIRAHDRQLREIFKNRNIDLPYRDGRTQILVRFADEFIDNTVPEEEDRGHQRDQQRSDREG